MMRRPIQCRNTLLVAFASAALCLAGPAFGDKPQGAGGGKPDKHQGKGGGKKEAKGQVEHGEHGGHQGHAGTTIRFEDRQRIVVRDYYTREFHSGHCPPGLAKKHNGCMPPGQARKWALGRPLPREVVYYDLPPAVIVDFGMPPAGYRYVRVATDILLIAIGTGIVVDAIQDLGRY
jgi:Ni/Co efflux regulator RcnB